MTDYRVYSRSSPAGFNGATIDAAVYTQQGFNFATANTSVAGMWLPSTLKRHGCSLIQVWSGTPANPGETVQITNGNPMTVRYSVPLTPEGTGWLFATSFDVLTINAPLTSNVVIAVTDLDEDQLAEIAAATFISTNSSGGGSGSGGGIPSFSSFTVVSLPFQLPTLSESCTIFIAAPTDGDLFLPPTADQPVGSELIFIRQADIGIPKIKVAPGDSASVFVNGQTQIADQFGADYTMRSTQESVVFKRIPGGWQYPRGTQAHATEDLFNASGPDPVYEGTQYLINQIGTNLSNLADYRPGYRLVYFNDDVVPRNVIWAAGEFVNDVVGPGPFAVPAKTSCIFENAGTRWIATTSA